MLFYQCILAFAIVCIWSTTSVYGELHDTNENCAFWASEGECEKNPGYMLEFCTQSCSDALKATQLSNFKSIYEVVEKDIHGNDINFDHFRGKVLYIVNVASQCGYTESNYNLLARLNDLLPYGLELIIAPCNQFGNQEPGSDEDITNFARQKHFEGTILSKGDVNGFSTRPLFAFLKSVTGKERIHWNFDGKFLVDREGNVIIPGDDVESDIRGLLGEAEL